MNDNIAASAPLLGAPLKVVVLGSQVFAESLKAQHSPVILIDSQLSADKDNTDE